MCINHFSSSNYYLRISSKKFEEILEVEVGRFEYSAMHLSDLIYSDDEDRLKDELDLSRFSCNASEPFDIGKD